MHITESAGNGPVYASALIKGEKMGWWRQRLLGIAVGAILVGAGAAAALSKAGLGYPAVVGVLAAAVTAGLSLIGPVILSRWNSVGQRRADQAKSLSNGSLANFTGSLRRVRDFSDPVVLGVHEAAARPETAGVNSSRVPEYVSREVDRELRQGMTNAGFILVTGPSTAGKSRTAYEAMRLALRDHRIIAPGGKKDVAAALDRFGREHKCVLWLDDLERFIGPDGITRTIIIQVLHGTGHHRVVVATIRDGELERHAPGSGSPASIDTELQRGMREVIEQAWKIRVSGDFSQRELEGARASGDPRIAWALEHAGEYGVTQSLTAAPRLLRTWKSGQERFPRGAALVTAAVDCRRAGLTGPLPKRLLEELHALYLVGSPAGRTQPESLKTAWNWATIPPEGAVVPLLRLVGQSGYTVFDYLVDSAQRHLTASDLVPRPVLASALRYADPAEAQSIAWTATYQSDNATALRAFRQAYRVLSGKVDPERPEMVRMRVEIANAEYACSYFNRAEASFRDAISSCERVLGAHDQLTLAARIRLGFLLTDSWRPEAAETEFKKILVDVQGDGELEISVRHGLAILYTNLGKHSDAVREFTEVIASWEATYGRDDLRVLVPRCYRALALERMDSLDEARAEQEVVFAAMKARWGLEHHGTLQSLNNLAEVLRKQGLLDESREAYTLVRDVRVRVLGAEHVATLGGYARLAGVLAQQGRRAEALDAYQSLVKSYPRVFGESHPETLQVRRELADILQIMGYPREAEKQRRAIRRVERKTSNANNSSIPWAKNK